MRPRFSSFVVVLLSVMLSLRAFAAPAEIAIQAGEIRFDGTVVSSDKAKSTLVINVASFTLPSGKSSKLATPKHKTIIFGAEQTLPWQDFKTGAAVIVIGKDAGSGKDVPARLVVLKSAENLAGDSEDEESDSNADDKGAPVVRAGETRYDGKITGVLSADTFTISLLSTTNDKGQTSELFEPQSKNVQIGADTLMRSRTDVTRKIKISELKIGQLVSLVGKSGATRTIKAREVAVWDDDTGKIRALGTVTINEKTGTFIERGDEARSSRAYEDALKSYNQALQAAMNEDDSSGQGMSHNRLALLYDNMGQPKRAMENYQKALEIWRRVGNSNSEATTYLNLASHYLGEDDLKNARGAIDNAIRLYGNGNTRALAIAYSRLGTIQYEQDEITDAIASWQQALILSRQAQDRDEEASVLSDLALTYAMQKQKEKSEDVAGQLLALIPQLEEKDAQANSHYQLGLTYKYLGQKPKAKEFFTKALNLWTEDNQRDNAAAAQKQIDSLSATTPAAQGMGIVPQG